MQDCEAGSTRNSETKLIVTNQLNLALDGHQGQAKRVKVVIIGAGLAGLAAAQRLYESGVEDVIILDAQSRVGGRVHTINHSDYLLELGAQWLHGADDNPLYQWLTSLEMLDDFQKASLGFEGIFCTSLDSEEISPELVKKVLAIACESKLALSKDERYLDHLLANDRSKSNGSAIPVAGQVSRFKNAAQVFRSHLEMRLKQDDELTSNRQLVYAIFDWFLRYETVENCCDNMSEVSIQSYTDWTDLGDGTLLNFKDGYKSLLQWFCKHIPCERWLRLNKRVLNVELLKRLAVNESNGANASASSWINAEGQIHDLPVLVKYSDTNGNQEMAGKTLTIACSHVIVTTSVGFLKKNMATFFTPELPAVKQELIKSIGFGTVNKIVLQFERPFWKKSGGIKLVWQEADFIGPDSFPIWCQDLISFDVVRRQPNLLIGWIGGRGAKIVEGESDETIGEVCLKILNNFIPELHERPSKLVACLCSRWHSNPFTCGSYSFQSMDSLGMNVDKLHEPLYSQSAGDNSKHTKSVQKEFHSLRSKNFQSDSFTDRIPRLMFAGEATAGKLYSTTHGAIISGWREADRLSEYLAVGEHRFGPNKIQLDTSVGCRAQVK